MISHPLIGRDLDPPIPTVAILSGGDKVWVIGTAYKYFGLASLIGIL